MHSLLVRSSPVCGEIAACCPRSHLASFCLDPQQRNASLLYSAAVGYMSIPSMYPQRQWWQEADETELHSHLDNRKTIGACHQHKDICEPGTIESVD